MQLAIDPETAFAVALETCGLPRLALLPLLIKKALGNTLNSSLISRSKLALRLSLLVCARQYGLSRAVTAMLRQAKEILKCH